MRVSELLLKKSELDSGLRDKVTRDRDLISTQQRLNRCLDILLDPSKSNIDREKLIVQIRDDFKKLKELRQTYGKITEAVHKLPITDQDFELLKSLMEHPIPAAVHSVYIGELIDDDELNDELRIIEEKTPSLDIRPIVVEWVKRVMPDQMYRFRPDDDGKIKKDGMFSPIHGYDPHVYRGSSTELTGNAYGKF